MAHDLAGHRAKEDIEMAEARFIKTVTFGGYDKSEVIRRLEYLNSQVYDLRNELRETKLLLDAYKKGTDEEKANETILAGERAKLTQVQVQNDTLNTKLKATEEENRNFQQKISSLNDTISSLKEQLKKSDDKVAALEAGNDAAALSNVFIEAQKSANMLVNTAKENADKLDADSKKLAENMVADANDEAARIIYEAEKDAAERIADAKNRSEEMNTASNNMKAVMLSDVKDLSSEIDTLRSILESFRENGIAKVEQAGKKLSDVENTLKADGVPVFKAPEHFAPELPEPPKRHTDTEDEEKKQKKKNELDKLKQMAEAIGGKKDNAEQNAANEEKKSGKIDLAALAAKASALGDKK